MRGLQPLSFEKRSPYALVTRYKKHWSESSSVKLMSLSSFIHSQSHENRTALENESPAEKRHGTGERVRTTPSFSANSKYFL